MNEPTTLSSTYGVESLPAPEDQALNQRQMLIDVKAQLDGMKAENEKLNQSIKKQKDVICAQATTIVELQSERSNGNADDVRVVNKKMEDELAGMKAIESSLKLKNAELEKKLEAEKKQHAEVTVAMDNEMAQLKNENEENVKKIKDLEEKLSNDNMEKVSEANAKTAEHKKMIEYLENKISALRNNNNREATSSTTKFYKDPSTIGQRELRTSCRRNADEKPNTTRRSSRNREQVNYALGSDDEEEDFEKPGPLRTAHSNTHSTSETPPRNQQKREKIRPDPLASSQSAADEDSDYVVNDDDEEPEYEEKADVKPSVSSEFEETNGSRGNSLSSQENTNGKRNGNRDSSDTTSTKSSAGNTRTRKRKAEASTNGQKPKKDKPQLRSSKRSETNRKYNEDSDENSQEPKTVRRSGRARPPVNYSVD